MVHGITINEARVMDFVVRNFGERNSINELGRRLSISPRGIYKILKKLEDIKAIIPESIGNAVYYKANLEGQIGKKLAEYLLVQHELNKYADMIAEDLEALKDVSYAGMLFGSILTKGKESRDIDVLLIIEKKDYKKFREQLKELQDIKPKRIHDILMVKGDMAKNLKKKNEAMIDMVKTGKVLWGSDIIVEEIKNGSR